MKELNQRKSKSTSIQMLQISEASVTVECLLELLWLLKIKVPDLPPTATIKFARKYVKDKSAET
jgi:hypothetical protein